MIAIKRAVGTVFAAAAIATLSAPAAGAAAVPTSVPAHSTFATSHHGHHGWGRHHWRWDDCDCDDLWADECWDGVTFTCEGIDPEDDWGGGGHWWGGWHHWGGGWGHHFGFGGWGHHFGGFGGWGGWGGI